MKSLVSIIFLFSSLFYSCKEKSILNKKTVFRLPVLTNSQLLKQDSIKKHEFEYNYLNSTFPTFAGKFKFNDSIDINPSKKDTSLYKNQFRNGISKIKGLNSNGLELIVDYNTTAYYNLDGLRNNIYFSYYPAYIINSTNTDKLLFGKDSYVSGIQEAQNKETHNSWKPIESRGFTFCGNGYWTLIIKPNEFAIVLMNKYKGDYKTELRTRIKNGDNIIVSNKYKGIINKAQFKVEDNSYTQKKLKKTNGLAAFSLFYGAVILEEDWQF